MLNHLKLTMIGCFSLFLALSQAFAGDDLSEYKPVRQFTQLDGSTFSGYKHEGPLFTWYETTDGYVFCPMLKNDKLGYTYAELDQNGFYTPSDSFVGIDPPLAGSYQLKVSEAADAVLRGEVVEYFNELNNIPHDFGVTPLKTSYNVAVFLCKYEETELDVNLPSGDQKYNYIKYNDMLNGIRNEYTGTLIHPDQTPNPQEIFGSVRQYYLDATYQSVTIDFSIINQFDGNANVDWINIGSVSDFTLENSSYERDAIETAINNYFVSNSIIFLGDEYDFYLILKSPYYGGDPGEESGLSGDEPYIYTGYIDRSGANYNLGASTGDKPAVVSWAKAPPFIYSATNPYDPGFVHVGRICHTIGHLMGMGAHQLPNLSSTGSGQEHSSNAELGNYLVSYGSLMGQGYQCGPDMRGECPTLLGVPGILEFANGNLWKYLSTSPVNKAEFIDITSEWWEDPQQLVLQPNNMYTRAEIVSGEEDHISILRMPSLVSDDMFYIETRAAYSSKSSEFDFYNCNTQLINPYTGQAEQPLADASSPCNFFIYRNGNQDEVSSSSLDGMDLIDARVYNSSNGVSSLLGSDHGYFANNGTYFSPFPGVGDVGGFSLSTQPLALGHDRQTMTGIYVDNITNVYDGHDKLQADFSLLKPIYSDLPNNQFAIVLGNQDQLDPIPTVLMSGVFNISGDIAVRVNAYFWDSYMTCDSSTRLHVTDGGNLYIEQFRTDGSGSTLISTSEHFDHTLAWRGIKGESGSTIAISNTQIFHAYEGVSVLDGNLKLDGVEFTHCGYKLIYSTPEPLISAAVTVDNSEALINDLDIYGYWVEHLPNTYNWWPAPGVIGFGTNGGASTITITGLTVTNLQNPVLISNTATSISNAVFEVYAFGDTPDGLKGVSIIENPYPVMLDNVSIEKMDNPIYACGAANLFVQNCDFEAGRIGDDDKSKLIESSLNSRCTDYINNPIESNTSLINMTTLDVNGINNGWNNLYGQGRTYNLISLNTGSILDVESGHNSFVMNESNPLPPAGNYYVFSTSPELLEGANWQNNFWGENVTDVNAILSRLPNQSINISPIDDHDYSCGEGLSSTSFNDEAKQLFYMAYNYEYLRQFNSALIIYQQIIDDYTSSDYAKQALERMAVVSKLAGYSFSELRTYYLGIADTTQSSGTKRQSLISAAWCLAEMSDYDGATAELQQLISVATSEEDSIRVEIKILMVELKQINEEWGENSKMSGVSRNVAMDQVVSKLDDLLAGVQRDPEYAVGAIPARFELTDCYPNPFNSSVSIKYSTPDASPLSIKIYDVTGRLVKTLVTGKARPGYHKVVWNSQTDAGHEVASGVYFVQMRGAKGTQVRKIVLIK